MKKIINGAKYDTQTAKLLGSWKNNYSYSDFNHCEETLYRTKSGKYFLRGEGGPMSRYAESAGNNSWTGGSRIEPMSRAAAMEWAEEKLDGDEYEEIFGEVTEDGKEPLNLTVSPALKAKLWEQAEGRKISISALVEELLNKSV
jgi:hypothetical protein